MNTGKLIIEILQKAVSLKVSDVHLKEGSSPIFRIYRDLHLDSAFPPLTAGDIEGIFQEIASEEQRQSFQKNWELDFSCKLNNVGRFRVNASFQSGTIKLVFRWVREQVPSIEQLGLPEVCKELALKRDGLVIITGPTGCGKSTTLAAMLNYINHSVKRNIVTIEDPIEFFYQDDLSTFSQREVGTDTHSFAEALKYVFRQDPDIILIGEMRDLETMSIALTAAETGHLILTTLHTPSSTEAIERFIDVFPAEQHPQVRLQLSTTLQGVLYQSLIPVAERDEVVPAVEVLIATPAVRNLIREGKSYQIQSFMYSGQADGMQTLDQSLLELFGKGKINREEALSRMRSPEKLSKEMGTAYFTRSNGVKK